MKVSQEELKEARASLLRWLAPGDTVYCIVDHVSRSGMLRHIRLVVLKVDDSGRPYAIHPNWSASKLLGVRQAKRDGLIISGCGMDMGFHVVDLLSRSLGFKLHHQWL